MPVFQVERVVSLCERLSSLQLRRLYKTLSLDPEQLPTECGSAFAISIWAADVISMFPINDPEQFWVIYDYLSGYIYRFGLALNKALDDKDRSAKLPVCYVGLGDRRFIAITGSQELLDITTAKTVPGNKIQFLETIQYNLTTLFMLRFLKYKHTQTEVGSTDATTTRSEGTVES